MRFRGQSVAVLRGPSRFERTLRLVLAGLRSGRRVGMALAVPLLLVGLPAPAAAEPRTWTDASGKFRLEAELIQVDGDNVVLQPTAGGKPRTVSRAKLSSADRDYLEGLLNQPPPSQPDLKTLPDDVEQLERQARRCRTAAEAQTLYQVFLADPRVPAAVHPSAREALRYWEALAREGRERVGTKWLLPDEVQELRKEAEELVTQALDLVQVGSLDQACDRLRKASALDPESFQADFASGMLFFYLKDYPAADKHFQRCHDRAPDQPWITNNLAVCQLLAGKVGVAARNFSEAARRLPDSPSVRNNLAKLLALAEAAKNDERLRKLRLNPRNLSELAEAYAQASSSQPDFRPDLERGWVLVFPSDEKSLDTAGDAPVLTGSGSGFVVAPGYVVTNRHVVDGAERVAVANPRNPGGPPLGATVMAVSDKVDLAILHVPQLAADALPLAPTDVVRGLEIMLLGYPLGTNLGAGLKSTRGAIVALPDAATEGMFLHDCTTNPGNSGGPVCDATGTVVGVCTAMLARLPGQYGMAVPVSEVLAFCREKIPGFRPTPASKDPAAWTEVDRRVSPSTVMVVAVLPNRDR